MVFLKVDRVELPVPTEPNFSCGILLQASARCQIKGKRLHRWLAVEVAILMAQDLRPSRCSFLFSDPQGLASQRVVETPSRQCYYAQ
jgi:hypothetical protein